MDMSSQELPGPITGWGGGDFGKIVHSAVNLNLKINRKL